MTIFRRPLACAVAAGAALLAGCGGPSAPVVGPPPATTTTAAPTTPSATTPPVTTAPVTGGGDRCTLDDVEASLGRTTGEAGQRHTALVWTNTSDAPCTLTGFGGVDLQGPDDPTFGPTYSLPRSAQAPAAVDLAPGEEAHTLITWLPPQDGPGWTPDSMLVTPPDETRSATVAWPGGAVLRQDGATRPGTYIDPVRPGAEP